jgi:DNA ligase D-like protein (predicted 3'-phosphoesterase)
MKKYVIHKHYASHLHWDLRLEHKGVLKSWAVPKEPSDDPKVKRLAVEVEDHKLGYEKFEGIIPEGEYGAGKVEIWDSGTYDAVKFEKDSIMIDIHGKKLKGIFHLVRFKKAGPKSWLFFKGKD